MRSSVVRRIASASGVAPAREDSPWPDTNIRGPIIAPMLMRSRIAKSVSFDAPEVAHRRHARLERSAGIVLSEEDRYRRTAALAERARAWLAIPEVGDVGMNVDEPGDAGIAPEIDERGALGGAATRDDPRDAIAIDDDEGVGNHARAIPETPEADGCGLSGGGRRQEQAGSGDCHPQDRRRRDGDRQRSYCPGWHAGPLSVETNMSGREPRRVMAWAVPRGMATSELAFSG